MNLDFSRITDANEQDKVEFLTRGQFEIEASEASLISNVVDCDNPFENLETGKVNRVGVKVLSRDDIMASFGFTR